MSIKVLGRARLGVDSDAHPFPAGRMGIVFEILLLRPNQAIPVADIADLVWPGSNLTAEKTRRRLQVLVSRLRQLLITIPTKEPIEIINESNAYRLKVDRFTLDRIAFEEDAMAAIEGDHEAGVRALARWRGEPYTGFSWSPELRAQRRNLISLKRRVELVISSAGVHPDRTSSKTEPPSADIPTIIQRRRLLNRLPKVGESSVGLLTAPAGYGKSVLLAQWAMAQTSPVAWVNLDRLDNDPTRFARVIHDAIGTTGVDLEPEPTTGGVIDGSLEAIERPLVDRDLAVGLVIDDLHQIVNPQVLEYVERWVESPSSHLTLLIASREPPPFRSARLESEGRLCRITARHLRFRAKETQAVLKRVQEADEAPEDSLDIHHQTEGWPIAISHLARTSRSQDLGDVSTTLSEYVLEEVLSQVPSKVASFLLATAHLDQLSPDLCDSVTGSNDAAEILALLEEYQLFVVGNGTAPARYHHLFSELLRHRAERDPTVDVPALQKRAARWYHRQSLPEDALKYALRGDDTDTILATAGDVLLRSGLRSEYEACRTWWHALDPDILRHDRRAHDIAMCVAIHLVDESDRAPWIQSRLRFFGGREDVVLDYVRAVECWYQGRASEALQRAERVIEMAPEYAEEHASDLMPIFLDLARATRLLARLLQGTLDHHDPLFTSLQGLLGAGGPLDKTRVSSWGFVAYIDGANDLAAGLIKGFEGSRMAEKQSRRPSSILGTITETLIASDNDDDPRTQIALAEDLEKELDICLREGKHVEVALTRLVLERTYHRAGNQVAAKDHQRLAETLIRTFEDAPYLKTVRDRLRNEIDPDRSPTASQDDLLTEREQVVLEHLDSDLTLAEIARSLFVSPNTIKAHTKSIYRKLKVNSRHQAVRRLRSD